MHQKLLILYLINNKANFVFLFFFIILLWFFFFLIKISGYFLEDRRHNYDYCIGFAFYL
jgi:hypothetical protein